VRQAFGLDLRSAKAAVRGTAPPLDPADEDRTEVGRAEGVMMELMAGRISAVDALNEIVVTLHSTAEPDITRIRYIGTGPLESLCHQGFEEALWPAIEPLARADERFRRALSCVWAYDSPLFERRDALLEELGEHQTITVRFVIEPRTFDASDGYEWRALEVDDRLSSSQLGDLLRRIADRIAPLDY
jgi:hypothetical protein